jgi:hypothetical protein
VDEAKPKVLWAVMFQDHIHTDANRKMAVFRTKKDAEWWIRNCGAPSCTVMKIEIAQ